MIEITEHTRNVLLEVAKKKKIYVEGSFLKLLRAPKDDQEFADYLELCKKKDTDARRKRLQVTKQVQAQNKELEAKQKENETLMIELEAALEEAQKLKDEKGHKYVPCYEHYRGRTQSAKDITRAFLTGKSQSFIMKLIRSRMRGHYTTSEENVKLKRFDHLPWRQAYAEAGIKLIPWEPKPVRKFDYIIEGKTYESISEVAEKYGITTEGVVYRCKSDSERFADWTRETIDE